MVDIISALEFDLTGKYLLSTGDKQIHVFHNVPGEEYHYAKSKSL